MKFRIALAHAGLLVALTAQLPALAQGEMPSFDEGLAVFRTGDHAEAYRIFHHHSLEGHTEAQYELGFMYRDGIGVAVDHVKSLHWFLPAAEQGHSGAQFSLGNMLWSGDGVAQDRDEAVRWYTLSAEQGHVSARSTLASIENAAQLDAEVRQLRAHLCLPDYEIALAARNTEHNEAIRARIDTLITRFGPQSSGTSASDTVPDDYFGAMILIGKLRDCEQVFAVEPAFQPQFDFGYLVPSAEASAPTSSAADALTPFWPEGQQHPDMAGLTAFYRASNGNADATVTFMAERIAVVRADDSVQQGYAVTLTLIEQGFTGVMDLADEGDRRVGRHMFYDALRQANTLLPEGGTIPGFLFNWVDPDGLVSPPEHLMQR